MASIVRGTTPIIEFTYSDIQVADITTAYLTLKQNNSIIIEKDITTATKNDASLSWELTQEETLMLSSGKNTTICCDWKLSSGTRGRSNILVASVSDPGKDEVI